jgi:chaperonin GroES
MAKAAKQTTPEIEAPEIKMMGDRILVIPSREDGERATRGGLVIPATANNERRLSWGDVLSVGPNTRNISVADRVLYSPENGYDVEIAGDEYVILRERDIQAVSESESDSTPGMYL